MTTIKQCPKCGAEDSIEGAFVIWFDVTKLTDDVPEHQSHWAEYSIEDIRPSGSADDPDTGVVTAESDGCYVQCKECGHSLSDVVNIPTDLADRWKYIEEEGLA
jgi:hypothetical protein